MNFQIKNAIEILDQTPRTVKSLLGDLSDDWTLSSNAPDTWSPYDVIGHYIHGEKTDWIPRARIILAQGESISFEPFDRFAQFESSNQSTLSDLLNEFEVLRTENLAEIRRMEVTQAQLKLKGIHPELGEVTLEQLLATWVVHDLTHIRQITIELAKKYSEKVGPWNEYLTILK